MTHSPLVLATKMKVLSFRIPILIARKCKLIENSNEFFSLSLARKEEHNELPFAIN